MYRDLLASRELAWQLLIRDIRAKYRQSFLGIFWAIIPAIVTAAGFSLAKSGGVIWGRQSYVMFSMTLWQTFVESLQAPI